MVKFQIIGLGFLLIGVWCREDLCILLCCVMKKNNNNIVCYWLALGEKVFYSKPSEPFFLEFHTPTHQIYFKYVMGKLLLRQVATGFKRESIRCCCVLPAHCYFSQIKVKGRICDPNKKI